MGMIELLLYSAFAGAMIPAGGWLAQHERISPDWLEQDFRHSVIAFGAGALLSAVALVLVPEGTDSLPGMLPVFFLALGAALMAALDLSLKKGGARGQMLAMLSDFTPEAAAMGGLFVAKPDAAPLLALLIGLQNLPEGFNAFREAGENLSPGVPDNRLRNFTLLALVGPAAALVGYFLLADRPMITGAIMCAAAGGILFLMFQDIAPQAKLKNHIAPPFGAVAGFLVGLAGHVILGGH